MSSGRIEPHLPIDVRGKERADNRRVISGIVHVLKSGCRGCDCLEAYACDAKHSIVVDNLMSALNHELEAADVAESSPAALGIRSIEELDLIRAGNWPSPATGLDVWRSRIT